MTTERKINPVKAKDVKVNDLMAITFWGTVKQVDAMLGKMAVYDVDNKREFTVSGSELIESSLSADQVHEEIKVNKTEAAEMLIGSHGRPFTVCFEKQDGAERTLRGRLIKHEALLGRSMVVDLDQTGTHRERLVDHRTIKWLIVDGTK
jgi:hypothetical protein